jgi:ATP-dependent DNA ligase
LQAACGAKAEGIISKRVDVPYVPGDRGLWRKIKCYQREEFVIVGYSEPEGQGPISVPCTRNGELAISAVISRNP